MSFLRTIGKAWPLIQRVPIRSSWVTSTSAAGPAVTRRFQNIHRHSLHTTPCTQLFIPAYSQPEKEARTKAPVLQNIPIQNVWEEFLERVKNDDDITEDYLILVCRHIKRDGRSESIPMMQTVMREINKRKEEKNLAKAFTIGCNMLIHLFINKEDLQSARTIFYRMSKMNTQPNEVTITTMINGIAKLGTTQDLHDFYELFTDEEKKTCSADVYKRFIIAFGERGDLANARKYLDLMSENNQIKEDSPYNTMLTFYENINDHAKAVDVFEAMIKHDVKPTEHTYAILLATLKKCEEIEKMDEVYQHMLQSGTIPNSGHLLVMGMSPEMALDELRRLNVNTSTRDYNACIAITVRQNRFDQALRMFRKMAKDNVSPDVFSYAIVIDAIAKDDTQDADLAFELFDEMRNRGIRSDVVLYTSLISLCSRKNDMPNIMRLLRDMKESGVKPNIYTINTIIGSLLNKHKLHPKDIEIADSMWTQIELNNLNPDTRTYNMLISLLSRKINPTRKMGDPYIQNNKYEEMPFEMKRILRLFKEMKSRRSKSTRPDFITYTVVINSLVGCGQLKQAVLLHEEARSYRINLSLSAYNNLMDGLEKTSQMTQVMTIWHYMKTQNILPDDDTYGIVLESCRTLGLTDAFSSIRMQRKADFARLSELDSIRAKRPGQLSMM
ncbi:hypothetical protein J3Q64DRAFT_1872303 [Phycomyces blakesleeanus]|uniref:Pentacotripeptide-repeat region of PRORP domain-containing protein n=2 Tax=Phycomyces blakesleeanus TaxID=4837 RepID=A0A167LUN4_PHYB8|nr:hypothetical protein PHYBLDRAFT_182137 [Phycomyces blakesleeanus NRRL 1555(-)]OAD71136.1 hypothetical protein PHYBLDRAFT_182137 [Phycomyces blakesleeanus NRRL 1555(-)]|eukprot:XP_018289176.1 hypothetical protein PHYBLDRAFT_182137 [Phycomyces blakesleeanus NRRL 1555(-)]